MLYNNMLENFSFSESFSGLKLNLKQYRTCKVEFIWFKGWFMQQYLATKPMPKITKSSILAIQ